MACTLRFVGRDSGGVKNLLYVTDTTNTGMVGYIITLNGNTIYSDGITAPHAAGSTISLSAPNTDGVITNGTYHVYQRIIGESAYENDFVLNYTIPANTLSLTIDGYSSTVVCRDSTLYTGLTISNYLLTHSQPTVGNTTSLTTPFTIPSTIYAGTHTLSLVADILWTGTLVTLEDRLTYSTTDTAYLLDENTVMNAVDNYKASYRLNLVNNKSEARNQRAVIAEIDLYEDDYWIALRRNDKLTAYRSLLVIYDLLNETLVATGEIPVYQSFQEQIASVSDDLSAHINAVSSSHSISQITGLQSALDGKSNIGHGHHKESITGLTILDTPEFADELITPLALEATYTPTVWAYLVGIFTSVPKSVKAHLVKMWGNINDMAARVGILEDSISTIEQTADDAQTAVSNHINATTAHSISQVDGLQTALNGKAPSSHGHAISDVSGLQTALNSKAPYGSYLSAVTTDSTLTGDGTASSPLSVNVSSSYNTLIGEATLSLGVFSSPEENIAITTVTSALITNANFKGATLIPMTTSDHEDLDEHSVEGINFMVENIIDNTSFDIRIFAPNGSWGNYKYKYIITY